MKFFQLGKVMNSDFYCQTVFLSKIRVNCYNAKVNRPYLFYSFASSYDDLARFVFCLFFLPPLRGFYLAHDN